MEKDQALIETKTGEIVPFDRGPISIDEAKKRIKENQNNAIEILEEGVDWEKVSGIPKPMLKKPAAEKLSRYAGVVGLPPVQAHYEIVEREADPFIEWDFQKKVYKNNRFAGWETIKTRGFYRYRIWCVLKVIGTDIVVGDKIATCSSVDPGKETAMENTILQQAQIRANRQAVMAYIGISDRFTEEEARDEINKRPNGSETSPESQEPNDGDTEGDKEYVFTFGKHEGKSIRSKEVPDQYLGWIVNAWEGAWPELKAICKKEMKRRKEESDSDNGERPESSEPAQEDKPESSDRDLLIAEIIEMEEALLKIDQAYDRTEFRKTFAGNSDFRVATIGGLKNLKENLDNALECSGWTKRGDVE